LKGILLTVKELYKKIDRLPETTRMERINQLLRLLSPPSVNALRRFKKGCKKGISPEQFIEARNKEIKRCIEWEFSFIGLSTRAIQGLRYLCWDTDLDIDATSTMHKKSAEVQVNAAG
jgi:hypothetical protein